MITDNIKAGASIFGVSGKSSIVDTEDATAGAGDILSGKTVYINGSKTTGNMPDNGSVSQSLAINGSYTIPKGYHDGTGKVTQSITTKGAQTYTPTTSDQTISLGQYLSGNQVVKGDANLMASNIIRGKSIFGVNGSATIQSMGGSRGIAGTTISGSVSGDGRITVNLPFAPTLIVAYCVVSSTTYKYIYSSSGWNFYDSFTVNGTSFTLKLINYNNTTVYWRAYE